MFRDVWLSRPPSHLRPSDEELQLRQETLPRMVPISGRHATHLSVNELKRLRADAAAPESAGAGGWIALCEEPSDKGFTILPSCLHSEYQKRAVMIVISSAEENLIISPRDALRESVLNVSKSMVPIANLDSMRGGRTMTEGTSYLERLERDDLEALKAHLGCDVLMALLAEFILKAGSYGGDVVDGGLSQPRTGARILATATPSTSLPTGGGSQQLHIDFMRVFDSGERTAIDVGLHAPAKDTCFFAMMTGRIGAALRVVPGSHRWINSDAAADVLRTCKSKLIFIPPFSFLIMRGDVIHGGGSYLESLQMNIEGGVMIGEGILKSAQITRLHVYLKCPSHSITNAIHTPLQELLEKLLSKSHATK